MTNRLLIPLLLLFPLITAGVGTDACEQTSQEVPLAVSSLRIAALALKRASPRAESSQYDGSANRAIRRAQPPRDRVWTPISPPRRPDNTRGDPDCG